MPLSLNVRCGYDINKDEVLKNVLKNILNGFGFGIGLVVLVYAVDKMELFKDDSDFIKADKRITKSIKAVLEDMPKLDQDNCTGIEGAWEGQRKEENGGIRTWHQQYKPGGEFTGEVTFSSPDSSSSDKQVGTWECVNSVLFTTVQLKEHTEIYNYLILTSDDNTKILSYIDSHKYPRTYIYKKVQP